jgi:hypothetical protein
LHAGEAIAQECHRPRRAKADRTTVIGRAVGVERWPGQAFWTLPALMQLVQTLSRLVEPFTDARTR